MPTKIGHLWHLFLAGKIPNQKNMAISHAFASLIQVSMLESLCPPTLGRQNAFHGLAGIVDLVNKQFCGFLFPFPLLCERS